MHHENLCIIEPEELSIKMKEPLGCLIIVDCRSIMEYSTCHICGAINIGGTRNTRRDIMNGRVTLLNILRDKIGNRYSKEDLLVVYDQCSADSSTLQNLASRVAGELALCFSRVFFLRGGFIEFQSKFCDLCWINRYKMPDEDFVTPSQSLSNSQTNKISPLYTLAQSPLSRLPLDNNNLPVSTSSECPSHISQLAFPPNKEGPSTVLHYLLLGTQKDALSQACILKHGITHVLNVSVDGPMCPFVSAINFLRIPVLDNFVDKITEYFQRAFKFLDEVKMNGGRALVHCSAGISRSPTIAIGYLMKTNSVSVTEAFNIVKCSRSTVCPNFNFMGQLTDYEMLLRREADEQSQIISIQDKNIPTCIRHTKRPCRFSSSLLRPHPSTLASPLLPSPSVPFASLDISSPVDECHHHGLSLDHYDTSVSIDQVPFHACQSVSRPVKGKRSATQFDDDSLQIRKRLSMIEPLTNDYYNADQKSSCRPTSPQGDNEYISSRSMSYEQINYQDGGNIRSRSSSIVFESCRLQECHKSTSSLSSNNSRGSNILV